jgi:hypothetical protein
MVVIAPPLLADDVVLGLGAATDCGAAVGAELSAIVFAFGVIAAGAAPFLIFISKRSVQ